MPMFDFPDSPTTGTLAVNSGVVYQWDGIKWTHGPGGGGGGGMNQTPWLSNIDGAGFDLLNVRTINVTQAYMLNGVQFAVAP